MMNKHIIYIAIAALLFGSVSYARIRVVGPDELEAYSYSFPREALHRNISNLEFINQRDTLRDPPDKYKASLYVNPGECEGKTAYIGLEEIELLATDATGKDIIVPVIIKSVSMDEHHILEIGFEYTLPSELIKSTKLNIHLEVNKGENVLYTLYFKDLINAKFFSTVAFVNIGGPTVTKCYKLSSFRLNTSGIKTIDLRLTHDMDGKFYSYWITPVLDKDHCIKSASVQIKCDPINLMLHKQDEVISDDKKSIGFVFGLSEEFKRDAKIAVSLTFDDNSRMVLNLSEETEKTPIEEHYKERGGVQERAKFRSDI